MKHQIYFFVAIMLVFITSQCDVDPCDYIAVGTPPPAACAPKDSLNLSTGIDTSGQLLAPGLGVVDPYWKLINRPLLAGCTSPLQNSMDGNAYVFTGIAAGPNGNYWVHQPGSSNLAPVDLGTMGTGFPCDNPANSQGSPVPYVFERSFCVTNSTNLDINLSFKGDDILRLELVNNSTGNSLVVSSNYIWATSPLPPASVLNVISFPVSAGSYSIRAFLSNTQGVILGMSVLGSISTTNGDKSITNNASGCCSNNTIAVFNVLEEICDGAYQSNDVIGNGWTFELLSGSAVIRTAITDINGNIFFSGLTDGTYTVRAVQIATWNPFSPSTGLINITVAGNEAKVANFFHCQ